LPGKLVGVDDIAIMFRKDLIPILLKKSMTVKEISRLVGQKETTTLSDLEHLLKSIKHKDYKPIVTPSACKKCGFEFGQEKLTKPSRCPECKSQWLTEPSIMLKPV
jgi:predicted Zn-ribbon and HTH transcriptional regulator